ncbi:MAG: VPLPA-CTERM sorting domain-containing protein [Pseudomonadota bacterium]|nr:VPLPA-CTERM sorting domain-containing protein [Pseudomonadota bacterium]
MKILKLIIFCAIFLSQATLANLVLRIDDPDSPSYIQMTIQGANSLNSIFFGPPAEVRPGDFNYFDGESLYTNSGIMTNESSWNMNYMMGEVDFRGDYFQDSIGFSVSDAWVGDRWRDLNGKNINGHNYYTYLSGQSFEIKMNAGQPDASSSAWVVSVDPTVVPLPAGIYLFLSGLVGLVGLKLRGGND